MSKVSKLAATAALLPVLAFSAPVFADSPGQLGGGGDTLVVKNLTQNGSYSSSAAVTACGDVVRYSMRLHNTEFGQLNNIVVKSTLGSTTNVTATPDSGASAGTSESVTVTGLTNGQSLSYVSGSTQLFDGNGNLVKNLADGVVSANGLNVGSLMGSTTEFVDFNAKVNCETQPKQIQVCELSTKKVITINEDQFDSAKHSKDLTKCQTTTTTPPTTLVNTGAGSVAGVAAAVAAVTAVAYNVVLRRRAARQ